MLFLALAVDGIWNSWTEWSKCIVTCGYGTKIRNRTCKGPYHNGIECIGPSSSIESCNTFSCPDNESVFKSIKIFYVLVVDGSWKHWTSWELCSVTCGGGIQNRTRECNLPKHGGQTCIGPSIETTVCNSFYCPVDGLWTTWEQWTGCTFSCGYGTKFRKRACYGPFHGGNYCEGESNQTDGCNAFSCPVDGSWKIWATWGDCSVTCGGGKRNRTRECNLPKHGGQTCLGPSLETKHCNTQECPVVRSAFISQ
ncbi:hypothetical protein KUTeg_016966 [Tegillarca granosa]|uniref:Uncharacterized protein n=1 Tax=Tegillarca granosa TaxID=220873 RepID=A0ABQ9EPZ9_TEGGR|nr:hypothetical protein KUTeg_016966 [Tegillarca granosa]